MLSMIIQQIIIQNIQMELVKLIMIVKQDNVILNKLDCSKWGWC